LDTSGYTALLQPSHAAAPRTFAGVEPHLFDHAVMAAVGMENTDMALGRLSWDAIPFDQPIIMATSPSSAWESSRSFCWSRTRAGGRICGASGSPVSITSASGVMYVLLALIMLVRGFADAI